MIGKRVEIHPGHDLWMRGARFGTITRVTKSGIVSVKMDHPQIKHIQRFPLDRIAIID